MKTYKFPKHINAIDDKPLVDADGSPLNFHKIISNALCNADDQKTGIDCVKIMDWARKIYKEGEIEMDDSDKASFQNWMNMAGFTALVKVELLKVTKE